MNRQRLVGVVATAWSISALGLLACSGDDTNPPAADAGASDATVSDGSNADGASPGEGAAPGTDASDDGALSCAVDAGTFTDAEVQAGLAIVIARKCQSCHGDELQGNPNGVPSTNEEGGVAYPPDLTPDPSTGLGCWTNAEIKKAFLHGIDKAGQPMCNPMPRFGEEGDAGINEAGAEEVIAYLRSIPAVYDPHVPQNSACPPPPTVDAGVDAGLDAAADSGDATVADAAPDAEDGGPEDTGPADAGDAD